MRLPEVYVKGNNVGLVLVDDGLVMRGADRADTSLGHRSNTCAFRTRSSTM